MIGDPANGIVATATQYDARGQVTRVHSLQRELASGVTGGTDLRTSRSYTAFGEVASETDARGATTYYAYNRMGRVTSIRRPVVLGADIDETGIAETRYYDISGRLAGTRDGNGNITTRRLAGGTGYGGATELVTAEYHADGGRVFQRYDDAGNLVKRTDELGRAIYSTYDKLGRLLTTSNVNSRDVAHSYTYDSLGRRLTHSQTGRATSDRETTDYDVAGRVTTSRAFGGEVTANSYAWDSTINSGLGATGGWRQTTTYANGKQTIEAKDTFGRLTSRTDMGGNVATTSYDQAGRIATISGLENQSFTWLNTGLLATQTSDLGSGSVRSIATFGYDQVGNRATETFTRDGVVYRRSEAIFDMQNRMRSWADTGDAVPTASMGWTYDKNGNIIRTYATCATLNAAGAVASTNTEERWFRFDSMNRMTLDGGKMGANGIERGDGTEITYRVDGSRATATRTLRAFMWVDDPTNDDGVDTRSVRRTDFEDSPDGNATARQSSGSGRIRAFYDAEHRETFAWRDDGQLSTVQIERTGGIDEGNGTVTPDGIFAYAGAAEYQYDAVGRNIRQIDRNEGGAAVYDRTISQDDRGLIVNDRTVVVQGSDTVTTVTTTDYGTGTDYALGAARKVTSTTTVNGGNSTTTTSTNSYEWRDSAQLTGTVTTKTNANTAYTNYYYSGVGQLETVSIGGDRPRTVSFINDLAGQAIRRDEADTKDTGDPHEIWYRHGGREIGYVGNNGSASDSYSESIRRRASKPDDTSTFAPLGGQPRGSHFAETIDRINSFETGSAGRSYTVQAGDTLSGIADQIWGDASLWYKLATANGLGADSVLVAGQVLTIPAGVVRSTYNADTYKPYDPTDVLGDINPNPKAKRGNKCGGFGKILLVAVAVAATIFTSGAAIAALSGSVGSVMQGVGTLLALKGSAAVGVSTLIAAGVVGGAVGSAVSQGVGLALGIQDKFNWAGVAMAGLSGGVGAGLAAAPLGSGVLGATTRGLLGNVITQGVAMATDQQKRFDWVGLGVAGVSAAVGQGIAGNSKSFWVQTGAGAASSLAGAATRSILTETSFGDNILAVLPDVIGSTVGRFVARELADVSKISAGDRALLAEAQRSANHIPVQDSNQNFAVEQLNRSVEEIDLKEAVVGNSDADIVVIGKLRNALYIPSDSVAKFVAVGGAGPSCNARNRIGGNGGPPLEDWQTLRQIGVPRKGGPTGALYGVLDSMFDLTGPALAAQSELLDLWTRINMSEIYSINQDYVSPPRLISAGAEANSIRHKLASYNFSESELAATKYIYNRDIGALQNETLRVYQGFVDAAFSDALAELKEGALYRPKGWSVPQALGTRMDQIARESMRSWFSEHRINPGSDVNISLNTRLAAGSEGDYTIPDVRVGGVVFDASIARKDTNTFQVRQYYSSSIVKSVFIVRPTSMGGSYFLGK